MKRFNSIILVVLLTFTVAVIANAQSYYGTYNVSYGEPDFSVSPVKKKGKLKQLMVVSTDVLCSDWKRLKIKMVIVFKDGKKITMKANRPVDGQDIFTAFFDVKRKHRKKLIRKEIFFCELRLKL